MKVRYRITSTTIEQRTDIWLQEKGMKISYLTNNAPEWHDRMTEQAKELKELREFKAIADIKINRLQTENLDLIRFKNKVLERMRQKNVETGVGGAE